MTITTITYGETINTGNYTSLRLDLTARVEDNEFYLDAWNKLRDEFAKLKALALTGKKVG
jgi:hypothetical protein